MFYPEDTLTKISEMCKEKKIRLKRIPYSPLLN